MLILERSLKLSAGSPALSKLVLAQIYLLPALSKIGTRRLQRVIEYLPGKAFKDINKSVDIIHNMSLAIFESKKRALAEGNGAIGDEITRGKDLMSILCEIKAIHTRSLIF